jgi:hypothetical protein
MNKLKKLAVAVLAVAGVAMTGLAGCTSMQVADLARAEGAPVHEETRQADETKVSRPLSGYGYMGGYRYRRFAAVAKAT